MRHLAVPPLHLLVFVGIMMIWGFNFAMAKWGLMELPPLVLMTLRFGVVALILVPLVPRPSGRWREILLLSFLLGFLHFAMMFTGLKGIDASTAAIAIQLQVPFASLLAAVFLKDRIGWRRGLGMAIAFAGVAVVAGQPRLDGSYLSLGLVVGAALIWAISNVLVKTLHDLSGWTIAGWMSLFATPQLALGSLLLEHGQRAALANASWLAWSAVAYTSLVVMIVGYGAWYWLLKRHPVTVAMPFTLLLPIFGAASGVLALGESLNLLLLIGGALVVAGVGIIVVRRPTTADPVAERV
ncbi:O-acetylserine/cysteine efflux transporter [Tistlia consotensis]|uniref:O-acetylserine/cysteine efflux transporter n=1 Tax=Tistlia consotensis USBA 355 TaxID=560819 RepID=A0A1Y6CR09_9PROT|nr:EamA family transporter [Tistlia consotensis]SMF70988.1 O-acetylserine/cysteine efflux transporter [Tistlia consotensis USBA 355]SNS07168.1 O-acetylserine/cysteine efflux transporter [Tistlia consotensis]